MRLSAVWSYSDALDANDWLLAAGDLDAAECAFEASSISIIGSYLPWE